MASNWGKVVDKAATISLGRKLIIYSRSVSWWDEELCQLVKDHRGCFVQGLDKDTKQSDCLRIRKKWKFKIREKRKFVKKISWLM